jgi:signal transduction histidine kinase/CHASE2 domain-containing sensor protein/CheY-like chemotaxis protein
MSLKLIKKKGKTRFVCLVLLFAAAVLFLEDTGMFEGINNYGYDLAFRLRGQRNHDDRIIIAAIDEKTLAQLGRWPIRRSYYADLIDVFTPAAAVGFDIIFSETSDDDVPLSGAIAKHGKIVLPVYIDRQFNISYPVETLSPAGIGHVHVEQGVDGFTREVFHTISYQSVSIPSFASVLDAVINGRKKSQPDIRNKIPQPKILNDIIQSDHMRINFYGPPGQFQYISVADILSGQYPPTFFTDKIVLVGKTTAGLHAGNLVPFNNGRSRMPAVEVHANILNNLLDQENIQLVGQWFRWTLAICLAIFGFLLFIRFRSLSGMLIGFVSLFAISVLSFTLFAAFNLWILPTSLYFSIAAAIALAYIYNLQLMTKLLFQAKEDWQESFNTINDAICIHDHRCDIIRANKTARHTFGPPLFDLLRQRCDYLSHAKKNSFTGTNPGIKEECLTEETFSPALNRYLEIKSLPRMDENGHLKGMVQVVRDVTENKNSQKEQQMLQGQLIQAQKMEAIGTLAGGIAHDFNNILAAVMGYTELSLQETPENSLLNDRLNLVLKASLRAKELVNQILMFSRHTNRDLQPQPIQIGSIIKEALKLIESTFPSSIQLRLNIVSNGRVLIDPSQMHQIIMNLCTNAKHAMQENGGILTVELTDINIEPQAEISELYGDLQPGPYLRLAVRDTGHGMAPDTMKRIFEPYFTTKEKGVGTGLGLAMVHGIAKNCGGTVTVESEVEKGTAFYVILPLTDTTQVKRETAADRPFRTGPERILFVDDEKELVLIGKEMLEYLGYQVVTKNSSIDALKEFREKPDYFDLVVTDMTMPEMTGDKLAGELLSIRSDIPIILCTGFSEQINAQKARDIGIKAFVMKPITLSRFADTVRALLDS